MQAHPESIPRRIIAINRSGDTLECAVAQLHPDWMNHRGFDLLIGFANQPGMQEITDFSNLEIRGMGPNGEPARFDLGSMCPKFRFEKPKEGSDA